MEIRINPETNLESTSKYGETLFEQLVEIIRDTNTITNASDENWFRDGNSEPLFYTDHCAYDGTPLKAVYTMLDGWETDNDASNWCDWANPAFIIVSTGIKD